MSNPRKSFRDSKIIGMVQNDQQSYNKGLIEMAKRNYEASEEALERCMRLRVFMYGPTDHRVATVHEAIADLKLKMSKEKSDDEEELKRSAIIHYQAALRVVGKDLNRIQEEEAREVMVKKDDDTENIQKISRRTSIENMVQKAEKTTRNMRLRTIGLAVDDDDTKEQKQHHRRKVKEQIDTITKRVLSNLRHLDTC
jgi:hypothetical protein